MGCGLRKLEDPDDSSPGKIFSTLKRPQVETKTEFAYEYALLDFTLQGHGTESKAPMGAGEVDPLKIHSTLSGNMLVANKNERQDARILRSGRKFCHLETETKTEWPGSMKQSGRFRNSKSFQHPKARHVRERLTRVEAESIGRGQTRKMLLYHAKAFPLPVAISSSSLLGTTHHTDRASSNPAVIKINSILDIVTKVEDYYLKGYIVGAIHPVLQPVGQRKHLPASYLYRVVLSRLKLSKHDIFGHPKNSAAPSGQRRPRLVIEECPLTSEAQTNDTAKELIEKHYSPSKFCNGTNHDGDIESMLHVKHGSDENCRRWNEGTLSGQSSESGIEEELHHESGQYQMGQNGSPSSSKSRKEEELLR
ncbi:hypothetical protein P7K49_013815 [Saguinus oedipus]|uniref:Uncharacterized protein n=1 Tax=Saguinus oedipus TaxID=9490 RepID=A0ABQ9VH16_SAGOE|nr:hypothetical protein P7K49_013815 [Saguinus oedipus]